ncbi:sulfurtransferase TusA family protein [Chitinimonas sp. DQS-5]|uniref:Sulfurtransferase TusA family protein n=1 Tax=Parachitinimonas caeni TaxID=3031301 RepID=A0ABT7DZT2_9NEIS|nr:sulfurtransferase TusA family protein [Parachitinimonas caeni]
MRAKKALADMTSGQVLHLICTDPATPTDFSAFCEQTGHQLLEQRSEDGKFLFWLQRR